MQGIFYTTTAWFHRQLAMLDMLAPWLGLLLLRLLIGWEFLEAGLEKWNGSNWFMHIQDDFPFPFNSIPVDISWAMATGFELFGGVAIMLGLGTRFFAVSLMILTLVATAAVHWPAEWSSLAELARGYTISNKGYGNFKLPVMFLVMLLPLLFYGSGRLGVDHWIRRAVELRLQTAPVSCNAG